MFKQERNAHNATTGSRKNFTLQIYNCTLLASWSFEPPEKSRHGEILPNNYKRYKKNKIQANLTKKHKFHMLLSPFKFYITHQNYRDKNVLTKTKTENFEEYILQHLILQYDNFLCPVLKSNGQKWLQNSRYHYRN